MKRKVQFWFEFASTYSYLSIMRIEDLAARHDVAVEWRPFLLGPIFRKSGWETSPFGIYENKGRNMWRDMERRAAKYGLDFDPFKVNGRDTFPQNSLHASRIALLGLDEAWGKPFCLAVHAAQFARGEDIGDLARLETLAVSCGAPEDIIALSKTEANKAKLMAQGEEAERLGIYGAPSFVVGDELFWGDDRLEDALEWASR